MPYSRTILAALFDMDGLLIDSEPLWEQAEMEILVQLSVDLSGRDALPDTVGLRIDQVVSLWHERLPWQGADQHEVTRRIIVHTQELVEETRPLLPDVEQALQRCQAEGLKLGLVSAPPISMLKRVLTMFNLHHSFDVLTSAESLPLCKPTPRSKLGVDPLRCVTPEGSFNGMIASKAARMRSIVVLATLAGRWQMCNWPHFLN